jgi:predicted transcriptional regulator
LPELLADAPRTVEDLAEATDADPDAVARVLRYLVGRGFFRVRRDGRVAHNAASDILRDTALFERAGLGVRNRTTLPSLFVVFELAPTTPVRG